MILRSRHFRHWMARLALAAILLVSLMPTVSRWLESGAQQLPDVVLAMCTSDGMAFTKPSLLADSGGTPAPMPAGGMPDEYCGYCPLLSALAPVLLALALFLPPLRRRLLPASTLPTPHAPPLLRGLGARGPPILL